VLISEEAEVREREEETQGGESEAGKEGAQADTLI
jgi:hypothetical protein